MDSDQNYGKQAIYLKGYITDHWIIGILLLLSIILLVLNFKDLVTSPKKVKIACLSLAFCLGVFCYFFGYWNGYRYGATHPDHPYAELSNG